MILVSNNVYRLGHAIGTGTRPRLDAGVLGVAVLRGVGTGWRQWSTPGFDVRADAPVAVGVDGEALMLDPPLRFMSRPGVLRVRIAPHHMGASPSAILPGSVADALRVLLRMAAGRVPHVGGSHD